MMVTKGNSRSLDCSPNNYHSWSSVPGRKVVSKDMVPGNKASRSYP